MKSNKILDPKFHVMVLNTMQQAALRYCMYNLLQQKIISHLDFVSRNPEFSLKRVGKEVTELLRQYDEFCTLLSNFQGPEAFKGKKKMVLYTKDFFKYIIQAIERYNLETSELALGGFTATKLDYYIEGLTSLIYESSINLYTQDEIKKEINK
jgi:hypothetical protein